MTHLKMHSLNKIDENVSKIAALFPNCVTEAKDENGEIVHKIDFDMLKQELSTTLVEGREERYQFTWPDKRQAILTANAPINKTLRPCREESVNFDETENLYIEGDNLEVLKLLQETYLGKIKMIYIDPPYNTGNDFVYEDDFAQDAADYIANSGQTDEEGNRLVANTESNGRFHTDWLNMMYPRLKLARDLLSDDGVIFISIDDNEQANLKRLCDEVFGAGNFIAQLIWERAYSPKNDAKFISNSHDYVLMIAKDINNFVIGRLPRTEEANARYSNPDNDPRGVWKPSDMSVKTYTPECDYPITTPSGRVVEPPAGRCWSLSAKAFAERLQDNRIWFGEDGNSVPCIKRFLTELKFDGMAPTSILFYKDVGHSQEGAKEVAKLLDGGFFSGPKPQRLMKHLLTLANLKEDSIVLDFFSGSGSTGHAVMSMNKEKETNIKFILVQLPELCDEKSEAYKAGYKNICEIGKERIRRAGKKIKEENPLTTQNLDIGFRVLKCDTTNMEDVYYTPDHFDKNVLFKSNIKPDRTPEDLLFQIMLDLGIMLSSKIETKQIDGKTVFYVEGNYLVACFAENVDEKTLTEIAKEKPYYFVMRDASMANDRVATNFEQIFKTYLGESYNPDNIRII
ncbi:site-specific DNA-methyltransferase [uncultured Treponema sp.]|uniref:site-specific DNA-methyltransferase n=1 Tax=uncultured Treponema sp. TaxID=162155 RepID=UPI00258C7B3B|nr:site-specific DNA-methyltransferase [uncultured Treponema sp.]